MTKGSDTDVWTSDSRPVAASLLRACTSACRNQVVNARFDAIGSVYPLGARSAFALQICARKRKAERANRINRTALALGQVLGPALSARREVEILHGGVRVHDLGCESRLEHVGRGIDVDRFWQSELRVPVGRLRRASTKARVDRARTGDDQQIRKCRDDAERRSSVDHAVHKQGTGQARGGAAHGLRGCARLRPVPIRQ